MRLGRLFWRSLIGLAVVVALTVTAGSAKAGDPVAATIGVWANPAPPQVVYPAAPAGWVCEGGRCRPVGGVTLSGPTFTSTGGVCTTGTCSPGLAVTYPGAVYGVPGDCPTGTCFTPAGAAFGSPGASYGSCSSSGGVAGFHPFQRLREWNQNRPKLIGGRGCASCR
jgi:hypothetical protein